MKGFKITRREKGLFAYILDIWLWLGAEYDQI